MLIYYLNLVIDLLGFYRSNTRTLWDLWWKGNPAKQYAPYRQLHQYDLNNRADHALLSKTRRVMQALVARCPGGLTSADVSSKSQEELNRLFEASYISLCNEIFPDSSEEELDGRRIGDKSYATIYDYIKEKKL